MEYSSYCDTAYMMCLSVDLAGHLYYFVGISTSDGSSKRTQEVCLSSAREGKQHTPEGFRG